MDDSSNNDVAIQSLKKRFTKKNGLLLNGDFFHVRCCAHALNLIVKECLKFFEDSITKVRYVVLYVISSPVRLQQFQLCCKQVKILCKKTLCLDVPTLWNSTFLMLRTVLEFQRAFECLEDRYKNFKMDCKDKLLSEQDWENVKVLCKLLEAFHSATNRLSGSLYATSNVYFTEVCAIGLLLMEWSKSEDPMCRDMALAMMEKFKKFWSSADEVNIFLVIAFVLDPRLKMKFVKLCYSDIYPASEVDMKIENVRNVMDRLLKYYQMHESSSSAMVDVPTPLSFDNLTNDFSRSLQLKFLKKIEEDEILEVGSELDRYFLEGLVKDSGNDFSILNWWKVNSSRFVILSKMARDILPIPVSSVVSESAFNIDGRIPDEFHDELPPQFEESLVSAQDWLQQASTRIDVEENLDDIEMIDSEFSEDGDDISF